MAEDLDEFTNEVLEGKVLNEDELWAWNRRVFTTVREGAVRYPAICMYRPRGWNIYNALYLKVTDVREEGEVIDVDFGDYFDFNLPSSLDKVGAVLNGKARFCRYRGRASHHRFNILILHPKELNDKDKFLWMLRAAGGSGSMEADLWRIYDRNQFVFWNSYGKEIERNYIKPIKRALSPAAFVAWLHQPLLRRMHMQRAKLVYFQTELVEKEPTDLVRYFDEDEYHAFAPVPVLAEEASASPSPNDDVERLLKKYRSLIEASLWCFFSVTTSEMRDQNKALRSVPGQQQPEQADVGSNEEYLNDDRPASFPLVEPFWFYNWSAVKGFDTKHFFEAAVYGKIESTAEGRLQVSKRNNNLMKELFTDATYPLGDTLSHIFESKCLIRAQINTMQSYLGTRVHMRAMLHLVRGAEEVAFAEEVEDERQVRTGGAAQWCRVLDSDAYFPGTNADQFITNLRTDEFPESAYFRDKPVMQTERGNVISQQGMGKSEKFIRRDVRDFMLGEDDDVLSIPKFTSILEQDMGDEFAKCKEVLDEARGENWKTRDFRIIGVEVPVYNPFCMFKSTKEGDHGKYRFFSSQADFVALATSEEGAQSRMVVMGEFKVVMERNSPQGRVKEPRTMSQSVTNAILFQMQTGAASDEYKKAFKDVVFGKLLWAQNNVDQMQSIGVYDIQNDAYTGGFFTSDEDEVSEEKKREAYTKALKTMYYSFSFLSGHKTNENPTAMANEFWEGEGWENYIKEIKLEPKTVSILNQLKALAKTDAGKTVKINIDKKISGIFPNTPGYVTGEYGSKGFPYLSEANKITSFFMTSASKDFQTAAYELFQKYQDLRLHVVAKINAMPKANAPGAGMYNTEVLDPFAQELYNISSKVDAMKIND